MLNAFIEKGSPERKELDREANDLKNAMAWLDLLREPPVGDLDGALTLQEIVCKVKGALADVLAPERLYNPSSSGRRGAPSVEELNKTTLGLKVTLKFPLQQKSAQPVQDDPFAATAPAPLPIVPAAEAEDDDDAVVIYKPARVASVELGC